LSGLTKPDLVHADGKLSAVDILSGYAYTSADGGVTWTQASSNGPHSFVGITSAADGTHLADISNLTGTIYTSADGGGTWTPRAGASTQNWTSIAYSSDASLLAATAYSNYIYVSTTTGSTWTAETSAGARNWQAITVSSDGSQIAAAVNGGAIYLSTDYGTTWTPAAASTTAAWQTITSSANGLKLAAAVYGGYLYTSADGGTTWATSTAPSANWQSITSSSDGTRLAAAISNGDIYTSSDSGVTWTDQSSLGAKNWTSVTSSSDGSKLAAAVYSGDIWTATLDNPVATITVPSAGTTVSGTSVTFHAAVTGNATTSAPMMYYLDGQPLGTGSPTGYAYSWDSTSVADGTHTLYGIVQTLLHTYATSTSVSFTVSNTVATAPTQSTRGASGGTSVTEQVQNLLAMGNSSRAAQIESEWPQLFAHTTLVPSPSADTVSSSIISSASRFARNLEVGITAADVRALQQYLNTHNFVIAANGPGSAGNETMYFGILTRNALIQYQKTNGIAPATGYFGPITRTYMGIHS
jgi:hypothetical protein